jgi:arsenate reductase
MIKFFEYSKCSTCNNALRFLDKAGVKFQKISIVDHPPSIKELKVMLGYLGSIKKLFNTSGLVYREMKLSEKLPNMSEADALVLLSSNGKLIKRPFLLADNFGVVGFKESEWKTLLKP